MSRAVKQIVAVVAAVAIPFVAPIIAKSAALATITSSIGMTATSALVGAGLGAANAAITGGNVGRGALMGGIGGGIGGYYDAPTPASTPAPVFDVNAAGQVVPTTDPAFAASTAGLSNVPTAAAPPVDTSAGAGLTGVGYSDAPVAAGSADKAALYTGSGYSDVPVATAPAVTTPVAAPASIASTSLEPIAAAGSADKAALYSDAGYGASTASTAPLTFAQALAEVPAEIAKKFSDPKALADMTLRAAGALTGAYVGGDGMSAEEKRLLDAQTNELRELQQTNKALFDQRLQQAQDLIGESKYFDPEYFGLQRARRAQLTGARARTAGLRGLTGAQRAAEERRFALATGRDVGTAYDQGVGVGVDQRLRTMQAGLANMPGYMTGYGNEYKNIQDQYAAASRRSAEQAKATGELFGSITGTSKSREEARA